MKSADRCAAALVVVLSLGGCANAPAIMSKPVEAVREAVASTTQGAAAASASVAAAVVPDKPVDVQAQRDFDAAKTALAAGRTADAERGFRELAAKHPQLGGAHANLGLIHRNAGRHAESVAALEAAVKASPRQAAYFNQLGVSCATTASSPRRARPTRARSSSTPTMPTRTSTWACCSTSI
jgi:Flp pilus assembly protein TadD